jgi:large conductance mechanosensitive channel
MCTNMPRLEDLERIERNYMPHLEDLHRIEREFGARFVTAWDNFANFALRDNVLEVAVGLMSVSPIFVPLSSSHSDWKCSLAASFSAVANSLVSDIILPIISLLPFIDKNLVEKFAVLRGGRQKVPYNTIQQALDDGAIVWAYGSFLDKVLRFLLIAIALLLIAKTYGYVVGDNIVKRQKKCGYCRKYISEKAKRCVNCTTWQDGREDRPVAITANTM